MHIITEIFKKERDNATVAGGKMLSKQSLSQLQAYVGPLSPDIYKLSACVDCLDELDAQSHHTGISLIITSSASGLRSTRAKTGLWGER